jgi:hypothetical protein
MIGYPERNMINLVCKKPVLPHAQYSIVLLEISNKTYWFCRAIDRRLKKIDQRIKIRFSAFGQ